MSAPAIQTWYDGRHYRSRLEARWAVFFKELDIELDYETEGYVVAGRPYLPDFMLTGTGTWVEVKGSEDALDRDLMIAAAEQLPVIGAGQPHLLILGPIPEAPAGGDWAWPGFYRCEDIREALADWYGFGSGHLARSAETSCAPPPDAGPECEWLKPVLDMRPELNRAVAAYRAARSARFEHGESGASR